MSALIGTNRAGNPKYNEELVERVIDEELVERVIDEALEAKTGNAAFITRICRQLPDVKFDLKVHRPRKMADNEGGPRFVFSLRLHTQYSDRMDWTFRSREERDKAQRSVTALLHVMGSLGSTT